MEDNSEISKYDNEIKLLYKQFEDIRKEFDSDLFLKLNFFCPKDMKNWIKNIKINSFEHVLLCLKYSDIWYDYYNEEK